MAIVSLHPHAATAALKAPLVVVIPVYNEAENIEAVVSEWSSTFGGLGITHQFLLINDGSKDGTLEVLHRMQERSPEQLVVIDKPNSGHGRTCRLGYSALTSKICKLGATALGGRDMVDPNVPYRLMRKKTLAEAITKVPASFDIHNVALTFILKQSPEVRWAYVPIRFRDRQGGSNSINLLNVAHLGTSMLFDLAKLRGKKY
jgi:cellulose synthase/poly-beta-1,6-N-acetylglucosamine synthase-like glycosyltransferase